MKIQPDARNHIYLFGEGGSCLDIFDDTGIVKHEFGFHINVCNKDGVIVAKIDLEQLLKELKENGLYRARRL